MPINGSAVLVAFAIGLVLWGGPGVKRGIEYGARSTRDAVKRMLHIKKKAPTPTPADPAGLERNV